MASDPVRDEAERLVAAAIAAVSLAARGLSGVAGGAGSRLGGHGATGFATGSAECCVCPVCRLISAMRDPSPDLAEKLATGAGDLATAVTGLLRTFGRTSARDGEPADRAGDEFWDSLRRRARDADADADPWRTATTAQEPLHADAVVDEPPIVVPAPKPMARKAVKKAAQAPSDAPSPAAPAAKKTAKKTVKKATKKAAPPSETAQ